MATERGEHPKVVAERLGHSQVGITLDVYRYVTPSMQERVAARIGAIIGRRELSFAHRADFG